MQSKSVSASLFLSLALACTPAMAAPAPGCGDTATDANGGDAAGKKVTPSMAAIAACTKIASSAKRLDCYDALTGHSD